MSRNRLRTAFLVALSIIFVGIVASGCVSPSAKTPSLTAPQTPQPTPAITTASLAGGEVGVAYSQTLTASGGTLPYTWSITAGALPAGLSLNASTGAITSKVTDSVGGTGTKSLSITIAD